MMVTFISQCQKKALARTRRVLDAFAERIGDNAWQTVITEEGLLAVKTLLRKTASKNTAVSCHWIRSRSRSDLHWIVGDKNAFNLRGVVPVNFTSKELVMDKLEINTGNLLANTNGQALSKHLFAVGFAAYQILKILKVDNPKLQQAAFIAGILHDIGKIDPEFQNWLNKRLAKTSENTIPEDGLHIDSPTKFSFEMHPRHHEISLVLAKGLLVNASLNSAQLDQIAHGIYWHHTKPYRKDDKFTKAEAIYEILKKSLARDKFEDIYSKAIAVLDDVAALTEKFELQNLFLVFSKSFSLTRDSLPDYKKYDNWAEKVEDFQKNVRENALNNLVRSAVISADRLVSSSTAEDIEEYICDGTLSQLVDNKFTKEQSALRKDIERCLDGFKRAFPNSQRNELQSEAAKTLANLRNYAVMNNTPNIGVLQGPAGCGKTKIVLEWALNSNTNRIIWICPRVQICLGLLNDLTSEEYLPNSKIEIFTGEYKKILQHGVRFEDVSDTDETDYFSGDIVITTIDQVVNSIRSHSHVDTFIHYMDAHIVFDEYHELVNMQAFNLLFAELIEAKKQQGENAHTLLVSATPHYFYLQEFLKIPKEDIVTIKSFNNSKYQIQFKNYDEKAEQNPLIADFQMPGTFVISNTALDAQLGYLKHHGSENSVLLHSKYSKPDKVEWFEQVFRSFKHNGEKKYDVLRSGPIVQASLNIACDRMLTEITCAENWLQRLGRLDRFGKNEGLNTYITIIPKSIEIDGKLTSSSAKFLNQLCIWNGTKAWLDFLKSRLDNLEFVYIDELYRIYNDFYLDQKSKKWIEQDLLMSLKKSVSIINDKIIDPISIPPKSKIKKNLVKISGNSLRGDNRFVQMAVCHVDESMRLSFPNYYVYDETSEQDQLQVMLTESIETMRGYGADDANLVHFMQKKHHNIKSAEGIKKARNEWELIKESRSPEKPIYLSYTPEDLSLVNSAPHPNAIYYVTTNKQPIGAMSITKLKQYIASDSNE